MEDAITREESRQLDGVAIERYGIPGIVLMENAGVAVTGAVLLMLDDLQDATVAILAGKGNNGGDGFVVARHLHNHGVKVLTYLVGKAISHDAPLQDLISDSDAEANLRIVQKMGLEIKEILYPEAVEEKIVSELREADVIVDAILGTGLTGNVREPILTLISHLNELDVPILSIDTPSGLDCNSGHPLGVAVKATQTVAMAKAKVGFYKAPGPSYVGQLTIADIGIPREVLRNQEKPTAEDAEDAL